MQEKLPDLPLSQVDSRGQIMLPDEVRRKLGLRPGDMVEFKETEQGFLVKPRTFAGRRFDTELEEELVTDSKPIAVLIADDHPNYRLGVRNSLRATSDMELVGEASTGEEVIKLAAERQPDVILMDLKMESDTIGIEATRRILQNYPHIHILLLTVDEADQHVFDAMCAGAHGYLLKSSMPSEVLNAIRFVYKGGQIFGKTMADKILKYFERLKVTWPQSDIQEMFPQLNDREREILALLAQGQKTAQIADTVSLSPKTVRNYLSNIYRKLDVASRGEALLLAQRAGMGKKSLQE